MPKSVTATLSRCIGTGEPPARRGNRLVCPRCGRGPTSIGLPAVARDGLVVPPHSPHPASR
ncbi:hypothetical protein JOF36_004229 [Pseudonocardia parietis]|uniref:LSD1 subclass zinc finger protein n=1 Tax=Pseudonocardia parietis TaxID=570936 RepID=A0ABS4VX70_9PSEU|nr:hypothetical protein [Pseudonocardia parietis]